MKISLKETLELEIFKGFRLVAGKNGLDRKVKKIGLLDHEMLNPIKGQFVEGEFALSTLLAAKDTPDLIYTSVAYLIESGSSGLGVKDIYYQQLPESVISLANAHDFPIFMFDNSVYFEDIITEFKDFMDAIKSEVSMTAVLKELLNQSLSDEELAQLFRRILGHYHGPYRCLYIHINGSGVSEAALVVKCHRLSKRLPVLGVIPYKSGLFMIDKGLEWSEVLLLLEQEKIVADGDSCCGLSDLLTDEMEFQQGLLQALSRARIADVEEMAYCDRSQMGMYQLVSAGLDIPAIQVFMKQVVDPIIAYDTNNNGSLFETAEAFVRSDGQIKLTAKRMMQHDNTIRYRLSKIRQILNVEASDIILYERLSFALRMYWLQKLNY